MPSPRRHKKSVDYEDTDSSSDDGHHHRRSNRPRGYRPHIQREDSLVKVDPGEEKNDSGWDTDYNPKDKYYLSADDDPFDLYSPERKGTSRGERSRERKSPVEKHSPDRGTSSRRDASHPRPRHQHRHEHHHHHHHHRSRSHSRTRGDNRDTSSSSRHRPASPAPAPAPAAAASSRSGASRPARPKPTRASSSYLSAASRPRPRAARARSSYSASTSRASRARPAARREPSASTTTTRKDRGASSNGNGNGNSISRMGSMKKKLGSHHLARFLDPEELQRLLEEFPWEEAGRVALQAGTVAAIKVGNDAVPWPVKGTKIASAALGAAVVDHVLRPKKRGGIKYAAMRHMAEVAVGNVVVGPALGSLSSSGGGRNAGRSGGGKR